MSNRKINYCSFCGKTDAEVELLIAGPDVMICDECVEQCNRIIEPKRAGAVEYASWSSSSHDINGEAK